jgi:ATP-binding cassette subfamily C protein CydC
VLIIEDDERLAGLTRDYLEANGFQVTVEADGARGVERILSLQPDLVILDEPFAGLDAPTAARLAARLDGWLAGRSVIYLVHQLGEAVDPPGIDQRLTLREGALCTDGQDVSG